jgi:hypothetical protein
MSSPLPDLAEDLAANAGARCVRPESTPREVETIARPSPPSGRGDLGLVAVDPAAGARDPLDAVNDRLAVVGVLQVDAKDVLRLSLFELVVGDETLVLEDAGDLAFSFEAGISTRS